ncbi:hypothetical protein [Candidatus Aalborgicola defluviihabitans]|jgi:hypothetical protein|uniref:hypothetical protein n=1 Tax=Candidatus Aalborgicola defluviihabitans TaxID=3386187 RepID=UPI001D5B64FA|nr:hypothetical protein [Burkholderiales bacterium]
MAIQTKKTEELFLKIVKVAVLVFMGLALLAVIALGLNVAYQMAKTPNEPAPAQKAPEQQVTMDDLKKYLLKDDKAGEQQPSQSSPKPLAPTLRYLEDVTRLYRCSVEFAKKVGAEIEEEDNAAAAQRVEILRTQIEEAAADKRRGERWVKAATEFTCAALADSSIIAMRKEGKLKSVFYPVLNFHKNAWDAIQDEKARFEQAESDRVEQERLSEAARIALARSNALSSAIAAAVAFGTFMLLAIYLLGAKIETNLREINGSIRAAGGSHVES